MLEHGEGKLMETETTKKTNHCSMMKKTTSTVMICRVYIKHHINKHTENRKGKVQKLSQAVDLSCRAQELTYTSHIHVSMLQSTATKMRKKTPRKKVMCDTGRVSTYYVHQHGEGELIEKETIEMQ